MSLEVCASTREPLEANLEVSSTPKTVVLELVSGRCLRLYLGSVQAGSIDLGLCRSSFDLVLDSVEEQFSPQKLEQVSLNALRYVRLEVQQI